MVVTLQLFVFLDSKRVRLTNAHLPAARSLCGAAQLSYDEVIVVGGWHDYQLRDVCIGTLVKV